MSLPTPTSLPLPNFTHSLLSLLCYCLPSPFPVHHEVLWWFISSYATVKLQVTSNFVLHFSLFLFCSSTFGTSGNLSTLHLPLPIIDSRLKSFNDIALLLVDGNYDTKLTDLPLHNDREFALRSTCTEQKLLDRQGTAEWDKSSDLITSPTHL